MEDRQTVRMTRARNGAAEAAPAGILWHVIPDDSDDGPSRTMPPCRDGDELLARTESGEVVEVTVRWDNGCAFIGPDGEAVEVEAIAERPRISRTQTNASRRAAGRVRLSVWITSQQKSRLEWIRDEDGHDFATIIGAYIDQEYEERTAI